MIRAIRSLRLPQAAAAACAVLPKRQVLFALSRGNIARFATRSEIAARKAAGSAPFSEKVRSLFDKIEAGCTDVAEANPGFTIARSGVESMRLNLPDGRGFDLLANSETQQMCFVTAKTGLQFSYEHKMNANGDWTWVHTDGHLLFEHLAREMVYHLKGYPSF